MNPIDFAREQGVPARARMLGAEFYGMTPEQKPQEQGTGAQGTGEQELEESATPADVLAEAPRMRMQEPKPAPAVPLMPKMGMEEQQEPDPAPLMRWPSMMLRPPRSTGTYF